MNNYIATFFSHYDALIFCDYLRQQAIKAKMMPVPRKVNSSCGTCVAYATDLELNFDGHEIEAIFLKTADGFVTVEHFQKIP